MKVLHIVASPREEKSNTLRVSSAFLSSLSARYPNLAVETIDVFNRDLPAVAGDNIESKYTLMVGQPIDKRHQESWRQIEAEIERFLSADVYLISTPMWNFSIPYALKYYIDAVVQPGYLFEYNEVGQPVGLATGKKMLCITSCGGDYSEASPVHIFDFQEPYLRAVFGFVGIREIYFVNAQPMDISLPLREAALGAAVAEAHRLAITHDWSAPGEPDLLEKPAGLKPASLKAVVSTASPLATS